MMSCASIMIGVCPPYSSIGILATIIVVVSLILQGISAGGEYNGAAVYAIEQTQNHKWLISGMVTSSAMMGLTIALSVAMLLTHNNAPDWAWRIGFLGGGVVGLISLYLRRNIHATPASQESKPLEQQKWRKFFLIFFLGGQTGALGFFIFFSLKSFLHTHGITLSPQNIVLTMLTAACTSLGCGALASRFFLPKTLVRVGVFASGVVFPLSLVLTTNHVTPVALSLALLGMSTGAHGALQHVIFQNLTHFKIRQRFVSLAFTTGTGTLVSLSLFITQNHHLTSLLWFSCVSAMAWFLLTWEERQSPQLFH